MTSHGEGRLLHLDGLRAIAVLLVVVHHAATHSAFYQYGKDVSGWTHFVLEGSHGVDLFFVLSGFCLSYPVLARLDRFGTTVFSLHAFAARRLLRIVPPYYAAIALFMLLSAVPAFAEALPPWPQIFRQALFLDWHTQFINRSFWTLCVEFRWYFIFPGALALWVYSRRLFLSAAMLLCSAYLLTRSRSIDLGVLLPFLLGIVAAHAYINPRPWFKYAAIAMPAAALAGILLEPYVTAPSADGNEAYLVFVQTNPGWQACMFFLVLLAGYSEWLRRVLSLRALVAIGVASYSIYLVHEPLVRRLDALLPANLAFDCALAVAGSVLAGFAFWFVAERPWVYGRTRRLCLPYLDAAVSRLLSRVDIPETVLLRGRLPTADLAQADEPPALQVR